MDHVSDSWKLKLNSSFEWHFQMFLIYWRIILLQFRNDVKNDMVHICASVTIVIRAIWLICFRTVSAERRQTHQPIKLVVSFLMCLVCARNLLFSVIRDGEITLWYAHYFQLLGRTFAKRSCVKHGKRKLSRHFHTIINCYHLSLTSFNSDFY